MSRLHLVRLVLLAALTASALLQQAAASAPAGAAAHGAVLAGHHVLRDRYVNGWNYDYLTYPDTPAGLAACDAKGESLLKPPIINYACLLSDPVLNVYNLWVEAHVG